LELLFNLLWLTLSVAMLALWFWSQSRWGDESLRACTRMQIIALAALILILLPIVSLTGDLQTCTAPVEADHLITGRGYPHTQPDGRLQTASILLATLLLFHKMPGLRTGFYHSPTMEIVTPVEGHLRIAGNLPPPAA
jgi:hypothetical protein